MKKYTEENLIIWQKWFDPFGDDDPNLSKNDEEDDDDDEDTIRDMDEIDNEMMSQKPVRAIATPMGLIPYTENTASSKIFNFWVGHTNFSITKYISDIIEEIDGVETLDVFTRYRFRIAIGKAFDSSKTMRSINNNVYEWLQK